jgi:addiction module RelE/StbE family toxin
MRVIWSERAVNNADSIWIYLSERNPAAIRTVREIRSTANGLTHMSSRGRPGRVADTRELVVQGTPYLIIYTVRADDVEIIAVVHGAQRWPPER